MEKKEVSSVSLRFFTHTLKLFIFLFRSRSMKRKRKRGRRERRRKGKREKRRRRERRKRNEIERRRRRRREIKKSREGGLPFIPRLERKRGIKPCIKHHTHTHTLPPTQPERK